MACSKAARTADARMRIDLGDLVEEICAGRRDPLDDLRDAKKWCAGGRVLHLQGPAGGHAGHPAAEPVRRPGQCDRTPRAAEARLDAPTSCTEERVRHCNVQIQTLDRLIDEAYTVLGSWQGRAWYRTPGASWPSRPSCSWPTPAPSPVSPSRWATPCSWPSPSAWTRGVGRHPRPAGRRTTQAPGAEPAGHPTTQASCDEFAGFFVADVHGSRVQVVYAAAMLVLLAACSPCGIGASGDPVLGVQLRLRGRGLVPGQWVSSWSARARSGTTSTPSSQVAGRPRRPPGPRGTHHRRPGPSPVDGRLDPRRGRPHRVGPGPRRPRPGSSPAAPWRTRPSTVTAPPRSRCWSRRWATTRAGGTRARPGAEAPGPGAGTSQPTVRISSANGHRRPVSDRR